MKPDLQALSVYIDETFVNNHQGGSGRNSKIYIEFKTSKVKYLVRTDKMNDKYILLHGDKTKLKSIKGQFKYVK